MKRGGALFFFMTEGQRSKVKGQKESKSIDCNDSIYGQRKIALFMGKER